MKGGITLFDVLSKTMALVLSFPVYEGPFMVLNWFYDVSISTLLGLLTTERGISFSFPVSAPMFNSYSYI